MSKRNLRVLHVHNVASVGSTLVTGLCEIGVDAKLYTLHNFKNPRIPKIIQTLITFVLRFLEVFRLGRYLRKETFDIVHIHFGTFAYLAILNRVPFFLHIHGTDIRTYIHQPVLGNIIRYGIKKAQAVFYTTPDLKPLVEPFRPDAMFFPNPIDTEIFKPPEEIRNQPSLKVFNINKIDQYKGLDQVLLGLELLWEQIPDVQVVMFGFGNAMEVAMEFMAKNKDTSRLSLINRVPHEQMITLIQDASIILGQMGTGALGCSELEAMACGKPVVCNFSYASVYPSPPPVFKADTAEKASYQMAMIINNPEVGRKKGEEAREWVVKYFNKRLVAEKLLKIYQEKSEKSNILDVATV